MASTSILDNIKCTTQATHDALNAWDYDALVAVRTPDFVFQGLPMSLNLPPMDNEQYRGMWFNFMVPAFQDFKVDFAQKVSVLSLNPQSNVQQIESRTIMHDAEARKSTAYCSVRAQTAAGPREWELVQMMTFDETGEKLVRLDEFFDSKVYLEMAGKA